MVGPFRLVQTKKYFGSALYTPQRGTWEYPLIFCCWKAAIVEHPNVQLHWSIGNPAFGIEWSESLSNKKSQYVELHSCIENGQLWKTKGCTCCEKRKTDEARSGPTVVKCIFSDSPSVAESVGANTGSPNWPLPGSATFQSSHQLNRSLYTCSPVVQLASMLCWLNIG